MDCPPYVEMSRCSCWEECFPNVSEHVSCGDLSLSFELDHHDPDVFCFSWIDIRIIEEGFEVLPLAVLDGVTEFPSCFLEAC